ncbi:MAG: NAD(P)-dependent oxidoreductase [Planctomycetota bacterium]|nr:MAG: NAD(P)-dependent oxidoreductase [Planctomycetota bacterium]
MSEQPLCGVTAFVTGASRGIGLAIALRLARAGANIAIAAKTVLPDPRLPGTIDTAARAVEEAGGRALPIRLDVRDADAIAEAVARTAARFGGIDMLINNAGAIHLGPLEHTLPKRIDLVWSINARATLLAARACLPWLRRSANPHVLNICPPLNLDPQWLAGRVAYAVSKYAMSLVTSGLAAEWADEGIAVNALWPKTAIATAAVRNLLGGEKAIEHCRIPEIMADAAFTILTRPSREASGRFFIDEDVLRSTGVADFDRYAVRSGVELLPDFFVGEPPEVERWRRILGAAVDSFHLTEKHARPADGPS